MTLSNPAVGEDSGDVLAPVINNMRSPTSIDQNSRDLPRQPADTALRSLRSNLSSPSRSFLALREPSAGRFPSNLITFGQADIGPATRVAICVRAASQSGSRPRSIDIT